MNQKKLAMLMAKKQRELTLDNFDVDMYRENLWMMYVCSDLVHTAALNLEEQLRKVGKFQFDDKRKINDIKRLAGGFVKDVDKMCANDFALGFGELCDQCDALLREYMSDKRIILDEEINTNPFHETTV